MATAWDRRSPGEQARRRRRALEEWLPTATEFAPHWTRALGDVGLVPGDVTTWGELARLGPSIQGDLAHRGGMGLVQRPTEGQAAALVRPAGLLARLTARAVDGPDVRRLVLDEYKPVHMTRAGVGDHLVVASSRADMRRSLRVGERAAGLLGLTDHDHLVSAVPAGPRAPYWRVQALALGGRLLALHPRGHGDGLDRCVDAFDLLPVTAVACPPDEAVRWAEQLRAADADVSRVVFVLLVGPPAGEDVRGEVVDAWRAAGAREHELVVRHVWAPDVHRSLWVECREGAEGVHTMPDLELLEVVDGDTGQPTTGGGDLTVTTVGWRGTTLLRYRTGHRVGAIATDRCPACGRTVPRITGAVEQDAWHLRLAHPDRFAWFDTRAIDDAAGGLAGVRAWRVVIDRDGDDDVYDLEVAGIDGVAGRLADRVAELTGVRARHTTDIADRDRLVAEVATGGRIVDTR